MTETPAVDAAPAADVPAVTEAPPATAAVFDL